MPYIRHTAVLHDEVTDEDHEVVAYEETPFGDYDNYTELGRNVIARGMHSKWLARVVDHGWEVIND